MYSHQNLRKVLYSKASDYLENQVILVLIKNIIIIKKIAPNISDWQTSETKNFSNPFYLKHRIDVRVPSCRLAMTLSLSLKARKCRLMAYRMKFKSTKCFFFLCIYIYKICIAFKMFFSLLVCMSHQLNVFIFSLYFSFVNFIVVPVCAVLQGRDWRCASLRLYSRGCVQWLRQLRGGPASEY